MYYEIDMIFTLLKFIPLFTEQPRLECIVNFAKCETKSITFGLRFSENNTKVKVELECVLLTCFLTADVFQQVSYYIVF